MADEQQESVVDLDPSFFVDESYVKRPYHFGVHEVEVLCLQASSTDYDLTGQLVWPGAELLNDYILNHSKIVENLDAIELGSGVGLTGLLCSHFCRKMVMTDHNDIVLRVLERNIELQSLSMCGQPNKNCVGSVECRKLDWGNETHVNAISDSHPEGFDIILGADICYQQQSIPLLFRTVNQIMGLRLEGTCTFILAYVSRSTSADVIVMAEASKAGFNVREVSGTRRRVSGGTYEGVVYEITKVL